MSGLVSGGFIRRRRSRPQAVLERFTARLGPAIPAEELLLQLAEALKASLRATRAEVWLLERDRLERVVSVPHIGEGERVDLGDTERRRLEAPNVYGRGWAEVWIPGLLEGRDLCSLRLAPVVNEGEPLGLVVVERPAGDDFGGSEERVLDELARHLGLSLRNERLRAELEATLDEVRRANTELRASRARIVESADAERRRIERDLHDGAQQQLIALSIELRRARESLGPEDPEAARRLDRAGGALDGAIDEIGDLAHGIYPPILREAGLAAALRVACRRHPAAVRFEPVTLERRPAAIETAIYFAVVEALQNAAKHAAGATVTIELDEDADELRFVVADDGAGFDPDRVRRGHGMLNIGDRLGAIGGTVEWISSPGAGTRVVGVVPMSEG